jgi:hypothetical protein
MRNRKIRGEGAESFRINQYLHELLAVTSSSFVGVVYGIVTFRYTANQFDAITYGLFISVILASFILLLQQVRTIPQIQDLSQQIQLYQHELKRLTDILSIDGNRTHSLRTHLASLKPFLKIVGSEVLTDYMQSLQRAEHGLSIEGSFWALRSYEKFWRFLVAEQKKIGNDPQKCLIARITHTNDVNLWLPDKETISQSLLIHQREFIKAGGKIVRILVGPTQNINEPDAQAYKQAKKLMEEGGIEVKYIPKQGADYSYDFAWIAEAGYVVKWYSGAGGQALYKCEILDKVDETIVEMWRALADRARNEDSSISSIPDARELDRYEEEYNNLYNEIAD